MKRVWGQPELETEEKAGVGWAGRHPDSNYNMSGSTSEPGAPLQCYYV